MIATVTQSASGFFIAGYRNGRVHLTLGTVGISSGTRSAGSCGFVVGILGCGTTTAVHPPSGVQITIVTASDALSGLIVAGEASCVMFLGFGAVESSAIVHGIALYARVIVRGIEMSAGITTRRPGERKLRIGASLARCR